MSNFTVDDTATTLAYGPGWGAASSSDPALAKYFQSTYHASESAGALVNLTFAGTAIYLYGSKGPNRGSFSVRYDKTIELLSAKADTLQYQQLLFSAQLPPGTHSLTLTNTGEGEGPHWVDLDSVTITSQASNTTTTHGFTSTISPLPIPHSTSTPDTTSQASAKETNTSPANTDSDSSPNGPTLILAIVFGLLLFFLIVGVAIYLLRKRHFRLRHGSGTQLISGSSGPDSTRTAGSAFLGPQPFSTYAHNNNAPQDPQSMSGHSQPFDFGSTTAYIPEPEPEMRQNPPPARPWSPFAAPMKNLFGAAKQGADSMKSTFLKV